MPIGKLDHYSVRTLDIEASRRFYTEVMRFKVGFRNDVKTRLQRHAVPFRERTVPDLGLHQVFFEDPSQVTIELNFPAHEARSTAP